MVVALRGSGLLREEFRGSGESGGSAGSLGEKIASSAEVHRFSFAKSIRLSNIPDALANAPAGSRCNDLKAVSFFQMHKPALKRVNGGLCAVARAHFVEQRADVYADGLFRDTQFFGNLAVAVAPGNAGENFGFTRRQLDSGGPFSQAVERHVGEVAQAAMHIFDSIEEFLAAGVLGKVRHRAAPHGTINVFTAGVV